MRIDTHKDYDKAWPKFNRRQQTRVLEALQKFMVNPTDPRLRVHQLKGELYPQYSISVGGDLRVHYREISKSHIVLMAVGTHAQLYK